MVHVMSMRLSACCRQCAFRYVMIIQLSRSLVQVPVVELRKLWKKWKSLANVEETFDEGRQDVVIMCVQCGQQLCKESFSLFLRKSQQRGKLLMTCVCKGKERTVQLYLITLIYQPINPFPLRYFLIQTETQIQTQDVT